MQGGAGDVKTVAFNDGTSRGLSGRVEPVLGGQEFHYDHQKQELNRSIKVIQSYYNFPFNPYLLSQDILNIAACRFKTSINMCM